MQHYGASLREIENEWTLGQALFFVRMLSGMKASPPKREKRMTEDELLRSDWIKG